MRRPRRPLSRLDEYNLETPVCCSSCLGSLRLPKAGLLALGSSLLWAAPNEQLLPLIKCCRSPGVINQFHQLFTALFTTKEAR